jgi:imidazolonepropionase-like amidohydrolase
MCLTRIQRVSLVALCLILMTSAGFADRPRVFCIRGATVVPEPGERLEDATVVLRDGLIEAVGRYVDPPPDAVIIDGDGLWVYPGFIDPMVSLAEQSAAAGDANPRGPVHELSRIHPEHRASDELTPFAGDQAEKARRLRAQGFTTVLAVPADGVLRGTSAAVLLSDDVPVSEIILRNDVAQHIGYDHGSYGGSYPTSLMGAVAAIRQALLDAQHHAEWTRRYERNPVGMERPDHQAAFEALGRIVAGDQPAVFHADSPDDVLLSARLADEFELDAAIVASGHEWEVADQIKATGRTVILPLAFPEKPEVGTDDEALDVTIKTMRRYLGAAVNAGRLEEAGVRFALTTHGLDDLALFRKHLARMVDEGLSEEVALAALTTVPAEVMGIDEVAGTLKSGKIANVAVLDGPLFHKGTAVQRVWVDGTEYRTDAKKKAKTDATDADIESAVSWVMPAIERDRGPHRALVFTNATVWTQGPEGVIDDADVLIADGKIAAVGTALERPGDATVIDAAGKHITPGLIDVHSHLAQRGGTNEGSNIITAEVRITDIINPGDIGIYRQLAGGLTAAHLLHGSANAIGGQDALIKLKRDVSADELLLAGRRGIKFALGENPKRSNFGGRGGTPRYPKTRMGVIEAIRRSFTAALNYRSEWQEWESLSADGQTEMASPRRDLQLETVLEILDGERDIHCHAYRQDEMLAMMRLAEDMGITVRTFEHGLEGYKIADEIAAHGAGVTTQSDWWGYKLEAYDATPYNGALLTRRGVSVSFSSDSHELARRLNLEAAKAVKYGGLGEEEALATVTSNAADQLRLGHRMGSLEPGKDADLVLWSGHPLSVYSIAEQTWVDGVREFDRAEDLARAQTIDEHRTELVAAIRAASNDEEGAPDPEEESSPGAWPPARPLDYEDRLADLGRAVSIVGATIHTSAGETIANGTVSFRSGRIVEVGAGLQPMADAEVIDGTGKHVFPGLIDANSVVGLSEISSVSASVDIAELGTVNPALSTAIAVNPDSAVIPVTRANGLTHVLTVPTGGLVSGSSSLIRLDGWTWEDLRAAAPVALHLQWPAFNPTRGWFGTKKSPEELTKERTRKLEELERLLEGARAYATAKNGRPELAVDPQLEAMLPVLDGTTPVIVHAEELRQIKAAVAWAENENLRLILAGRKDMWRAAEMLAEKRVPVIVTNVLALPGREDELYDTAYATPARLHEAGVDFCIAGAANSFSASNTRNLPDQAAMAAAFGLPREAALEAITAAPARILGVGAELGSIEPGKSASLVITDGDILEIRTTVERVFIDGREADLTTRHTRLYERYAGRPELN